MMPSSSLAHSRSSEEDSSPPRPPRPFFIPGDISDSDRERDTRSHGSSLHHLSKHPRKASSKDSLPPRQSSFPIDDGPTLSTFPPSSFHFPFQAYAGNPDPLPGLRKHSFDSFRLRERSSSADGHLHHSPVSRGVLSSSSTADLHSESIRPYPPFMAQSPVIGSSPTPSLSNVYRGSAAAALASPPPMQDTFANRANMFRAPFLSPASRPSSTIWQPPIYPLYGNGRFSTANGSRTSLPLKRSRPPMPSTKLASELTIEDKFWISETDSRIRLSWWLTVFFWFLGACGGAAICYLAWVDVHLLSDSQLCPLFVDNFDNFDTSIWTKDVELGGFGNGEFQMTTDSDTNLYVSNGQLYILPTLTSVVIGNDTVFNGGNYTLSGCTSTNQTACSASSNSLGQTVINPVQSARISTKNSYSLKYGKVEVRAKLPRGDWLWPAIWMLPVNSSYGDWPASGELDIMEARGNLPTYPAQGSNFVRSSLNYGPLASIMAKIYGWKSEKRSSYDQSFHTYTLEWTDSWIRISVDSKITAMLDLTLQGKGGKSFWDRGNFPQTAQNGSAQVVVNKIYQSASAPFDQNFYLILDLAAGGTSGWFPDSVGNKPWYDGSTRAMYDFASNQGTWSATWPSSADDRAFRIDYVKMWSLGPCTA